jgi:hypothetical protein
MAMNRKNKALTLVPVVIFSGAWSATVPGSSAAPGKPTSAALAPERVAIPDVPASAQRDAASVTMPVGAVHSVESIVGIPSTALVAYQRAAQILDAADSQCHVHWELLAAIGRVESDHGRAGGGVLRADGVVQPHLFGAALDGRDGRREVSDTDAGVTDEDAIFDRPVGPMQFLPATWSQVKVDADGDGIRNPQDIDDAALASAVYLCAGSEDLAVPHDLDTALLRYNHSADYLDLVLRIADAYAKSEYSAVPTETYAGELFLPAAEVPHRPSVKDSSHADDVPANSGPDKAPAPVDEAPDADNAPAAPAAKADRGLTGTVTKVVKNPTHAVPVVVNELAATAECLASGVQVLDVRGLTECVLQLLG